MDKLAVTGLEVTVTGFVWLLGDTLRNPLQSSDK